jgi:sarcosine oxidase subunit gamma
MSDVTSALGADYEPGREVPGADGTIGVIFTEILGRQMLQVSAWPDSLAALSELLQERILCPLPEKPGTSTSGGGVTALWTQPGTALLVTDHVPMLERLAGHIPAELGCVTELTAARSVIRIGGPFAPWVLAKIVAVDLAAESASVGSCYTTGAHDLALLIHVRESKDKAGRGNGRGFELYVPRSFARSFWEDLQEAALETGYRIAG